MALRTNYKDDVYSGNRKYSMTTNPDTTVSFTDETDYTQQGDTYGAAQINEQNAKINDLDSNAYRQTDTAETSLADNDYVPFYDTSASAKRKVLLSKLKDFLLGALAPKVHDSNSAGTYGAGTGSKFGHVKLSDSYTTSGGAASSSVGASSQAVYDAYRNRAPVNHASSDTTYGRGNASQYGHVKLSDSYASNAGAASAGMGASGKAVYDSYTNLNGKINTANSNISGLSTRMGNVETRLTTDEGNISELRIGVGLLKTRMNTAEGEISSLINTRSVWNSLYPNLEACLKCVYNDIAVYRSHMLANFYIIRGKNNTAISAYAGTNGSSGRPWEYDDVCPTESVWENSYGYVPIENAGVGNYTFLGYTNPGILFENPYCDIHVYNHDGIRQINLYIVSYMLN